MEFHAVYVLWYLLPITFVCLTFYAFCKPIIKAHGKESPKKYFMQAVFCSVGLAIAIYFDQIFTAELAMISGADEILVRWLMYPGVLLTMATVQHYYENSYLPKKAQMAKKRREVKQVPANW